MMPNAKSMLSKEHYMDSSRVRRKTSFLQLKSHDKVKSSSRVKKLISVSYDVPSTEEEKQGPETGFVVRKPFDGYSNEQFQELRQKSPSLVLLHQMYCMNIVGDHDSSREQARLADLDTSKRNLQKLLEQKSKDRMEEEKRVRRKTLAQSPIVQRQAKTEHFHNNFHYRRDRMTNSSFSGIEMHRAMLPLLESPILETERRHSSPHGAHASPIFGRRNNGRLAFIPERRIDSNHLFLPPTEAEIGLTQPTRARTTSMLHI